MTISDEEWLAAARSRASTGDWERAPDELFAAIRRAARPPAPAPAAPPCPFCADHPPLQRFQRYELQTTHPLLFCGNCLGFWATGDALTRGVADAGQVHPALHAARAPRRCRSCFGHLKPDGVCAKCGKSLPKLNCPGCARPVERVEKDGIVLDQCASCTGVWFDMGEITAVFGLPPAQGLAASLIDEHATDDEPPGWQLLVISALRMLAPFL